MRKAPLVLVIFAQPSVFGFNGISGVDDLPDLPGEGEDRGQMVPLSAPQRADRGMMLIPAVGKAVQIGFSPFDGGPLVVRPKIPDDLYDSCKRHRSGCSHHADDEELHLGLGVHSLNGLRKARKAVTAGDKDIANTPVLVG